VALGKPEVSTHASVSHQDQLESQLAQVRVGASELVTQTGTVNFGATQDTGIPTGFMGVWASYDQRLTDGSTMKSFSFGTAPTEVEATLKATAEALERIASDTARVDQPATPAVDLDATWIDPRHAAPLSAEQLRLAATVPFHAKLPIDWTLGERLGTGAPVYAPADFVQYPASGNIIAARNNSNGVAAHFDRDIAVEHGLLELIERDGIMRAWILQTSPERITHESAPPSVKYRLEELTRHGKQVDLLDLTGESGVPCYMVSIRSEKFPHLYVGAAANFDPEIALHKALDEVVAGVSSRVTIEESLRAQEVHKRAAGIFDTDSHGMLYAEDLGAVKQISWLFEGQQTGLQVDKVPSMQELIARYNPAVFEFDNPAPGNGLRVVRVIAEDLIPITFGKTGVPYLHHTLPRGVQPPSLPHFFN
jgi:thiazole/oxazole-forming peptide maturase SagD family component